MRVPTRVEEVKPEKVPAKFLGLKDQGGLLVLVNHLREGFKDIKYNYSR